MEKNDEKLTRESLAYKLTDCHPTAFPINTRRWPSVGLTLGQRRGRWANIKSTLGQCRFEPAISDFSSSQLYPRTAPNPGLMFNPAKVLDCGPILKLVWGHSWFAILYFALPFSPSRCIKASYYIPVNRLNFPTTKGFRMKNYMKLVYQYIAISFNFSTISNHLHPLHVENCDSNLRLVVDEDNYAKFRLERVKIALC